MKSWYKPGAVLAVLLILFLTALQLLGRRWWCACGQSFLFVGSAWSDHTSQHLIDPYTFTHFLHGFVFWWLLSYWASPSRNRWLFVLGVVIEVVWEIFENTPYAIEHYRQNTGAVSYAGDTIINSLGDVVICAAGFIVARQLGWRWSLAIFLVIEIALAFWIRDNLTLNVLMFFWSSPALKEWQMGAAVALVSSTNWPRNFEVQRKCGV